MQASEATRLVAMLKAAYPRQQLAEDSIALYAAFLSDLDRISGERAVRTAIATLKFFPTVGELRDLAARQAVELLDETAAWADVTRAIGRYGRYRTPKFRHAAVERVVDAMGWLSICDSENLEATRAHFFRLYRDSCDSAVRNANVQPMLAAADERRLLVRSAEAVPVGDVVKRLLPGGSS